MKAENQNELNALVHLLDDPDQEVNKIVVNKLISLGPEIIPSLEEYWEKSPDALVHKKIEEVIHIIHSDTLRADLTDWTKNHSDDLLQGAILVAKHLFPDINILKIQNQVEKLKKDIWLEMNYNLTPLEQVNVFNHVFYSLNGYRGTEGDGTNPAFCYINHLLETKKGNPISLGILYLIVANQLQMPVYGVDLPQHFILSYHNHPIQNEQSEQEIRSDIIFYINPLNKGMIFSREDITHYLHKLEVKPEPSHFSPCNNIQVIRSLINYLITGYELQNENDKVLELKELLNIFG
ncbi:MAG: hypothetical protein D4R43_01945 [Sphingobacteriales bacterium]|nr:MAG: hypothetical protein D4R43_01945 [Sphingobacteriales bacterium]